MKKFELLEHTVGPWLWEEPTPGHSAEYRTAEYRTHDLACVVGGDIAEMTADLLRVVGHLNSTPFLGVAPGLLRCEAQELKQVTHFAGTRPAGGDAPDLTPRRPIRYEFRERRTAFNDGRPPNSRFPQAAMSAFFGCADFPATGGGASATAE